MALQMRQTQRMVQELRITPQLQQAIKLLQLSRQELVEQIQEEMIENPLLEEVIENSQAEPRPREEQAEPFIKSLDAQKTSSDEVSPNEAVDDIDWASYLENYSSPLPGGSSQGFDELPSYENTLSSKLSLSEHLLWQLGMMVDVSDQERSIAEIIIRALNDAGYLFDDPLEVIAKRENVSFDLIEDALTIVQSFDPIGVAARTLSESLCLQAQYLYPRKKLLQKVITSHLPDLERRKYVKIARVLKKSRDEILDIHRLIQTLDPRPGHQYNQTQPHYITPDIYIMRQGNDWIPILNEDGLPHLRVSTQYQKMIQTGPLKNSKNKTQDSAKEKARSYVQEKLFDAAWLIRSIQQRQQTILKVTQSIIRFQREFFDKGIDYLRPLVLREVADDIEMHESTISRVTTNKYVHTSRGIYELKFFFNSSIETKTGNIAAESVKHRIKEIISTEPSAKPFSDQLIVKILMDEYDVKIARRTVAKYRESLGILSSSRRKQLI